MQSLTQFVRTLGAARLAAMAAVTVTLIGFFAFVIMRVTNVPMTALYTELSMEDSTGIIKELERQAIPYELKNDGGTIMVPQDKVTRLRMKLAEGGMPKGGGIGYEIFDKSETLGTTSFVQNINHMRAMEGELSRTIRAIDRVQAARVHLVVPDRPLFARDKQDPSAAIVLKVRGSLEKQQVRAIRHLVASAVNGLKPQRVSIVDETGKLLADGTTDGEAADSGTNERQLSYEQRLREQVESIVSSVVGAGRARVNVSTQFDFNRITQTSDRYDPEGRVLRSSQTREESTGTDGNQGAVSASNELPGAAQNTNPATPRDQSKKSEEITNYEISRTTKTEVIEGGRVNKVAIAVLVDGIYNKNEKGESVYQDRPKEQLDRIAALVRSSVGYDAKRGDVVEVVNLRFAETPPQIINEPTGIMSMLQFTKDDLMRGIEMLVMSILGIVVLLMVVRPLVRRVITPDEAALRPADALAEANALQITQGGDQANTPQIESDQPIAIPSNKTSKMIDIAQVKGQVHAQSVQKVGELADSNPNEAISIVRSWLNDAPA